MLPSCTQLIHHLCDEEPLATSGASAPDEIRALGTEAVKGANSIEIAQLRQIFYCPLCGSLLLNDPVCIQPCGHCFCYHCINAAIEDGVELLRPGNTARGNIDGSTTKDVNMMTSNTTHPAGQQGGRVHRRKRARKMRFTCPVCAGPAFKWTLVRVPLIRELCVELRDALPEVVTEGVASFVPQTAIEACEARKECYSSHASRLRSTSHHDTCVIEDTSADSCSSPVVATDDVRGNASNTVENEVDKVLSQDTSVSSSGNVKEAVQENEHDVIVAQAQKNSDIALAANNDTQSSRLQLFSMLHGTHSGVAGVYKELLYTDVP